MNMLKEAAETLLKVEKKQITLAVNILFDCWKRNGIVFTCGNGGSSASASHMASDLRKWASDFTLKTFCLSDNISLLTAITNDNGWSEVYQKQLMLTEDRKTIYDVLLAFSVHGGGGFSENLVNAFRRAETNEMRRISFTGHDGGKLKELSTVNINVPSESTPIIEGLHSVLAHVVAEELRKKIEGEK